ncbi:polysaccharide pyruvyl transferase family protein [Thiocapsa bogorovii]|nr:polysaccharide pyruvyl transferase family protein [Thiocapsa bogorovii]
MCYRLLRKVFPPEAITVQCFDAMYLEKHLPGIRTVSATAQVVDADLLVYGGGTQFYSFPLTGTRVSVYRRQRLLRALARPHHVLRYLLDKHAPPQTQIQRVTRHSAAVAVGIGPFMPDSIQEDKARAVLSNLEFISVRDPASLDVCTDWGREDVILGSDICFLPGLLKLTTDERLYAPVRNKAGKNIGIVFRRWPHSQEGAAYVKPLVQAASHLRTLGYHVTWISFCKTEDAQIIGELGEAANSILYWTPEQLDVPQFLAILARFDCFITARYHGAVFSTLLRKPCVCVEVEQKLALASECFGMRPYLWEQPFRTNNCIAAIDAIFTNYSHCVQQIDVAATIQTELAQNMAALFVAFLRRFLTGHRQ